MAAHGYREQDYSNLTLMNALVARMVENDPSKRPATMDEVVAEFKDILSRLTDCRLRERMIERRDGGFVNSTKGVYYVTSHTLPSSLRPPSRIPDP